MANTPNLDLVKPAGTDKALVSVINSNSDKIDAGFGSLSDQIGALTPNTGITGYGGYVVKGNTVNIWGCFAKGASTWTLFTGAPKPASTIEITRIPWRTSYYTIFVDNDGRVQLQDSNTSSDYISFSASYNVGQTATSNSVVASLANQIANNNVSSVFSTLYYKETNNLIIVSGFFKGDGTSSVALGIGSTCSGLAQTRNLNTGALEQYYINGGSISGYDGSTNRIFTNNVTYMISAVLSK